MNESMTVEDCIRAHQKDLKMVQKVTIVCTIFAFVLGFVVGVIIH